MAAANDQVFGNISDHCISNIMKYLKPRDLLECGRACKRLQKLSRRQFLKNHSMREVQIRLLDNGRLSVTPSAKNFHYYGNIFRNVSIRSWNFQTNRNLKLANVTNFMLNKCAQNLYRIYIVGDIELGPFGQIIQDRLQHVQTVEFRNRHGTFDEAQFLQLCPNLKKLILGTGIDNTNVDAILQQAYKQLTHFYCLYGSVDNLSPERLEQFFENNNKIKSIVWKFGMCSDVDRLDTVDFIGTLQYLPHLQHLLFSFADQLAKYSDVEFEVMCQQLIDLCNRDAFQRLELALFCPRQSAIDAPTVIFRMTHFAEMHKLTKIHLNRFPLVALIPTLRSLVNLRSLVLYDCRMNAFYEDDNDSTDDGSSASGDTDDNPQLSLPQVQEIYYKNGRYDNLTTVLMLPIRHWKNLKRIYVPANYGISLDVAELNQARETLNNACVVNIFTNHKSLPTNLQYELVKLRCVDSINTVKLRRKYN